MTGHSSEPNWQPEQARRNWQTRNAWMNFAPHRQRVTQLLLEAAGGLEHPVLTLLGAGNCNDVDLPALLTAYRTVRLLDIDAGALESAVSRQGLADCPAIAQFGNVDLAAKAALPANAAEPAADVVASLCVLSQILEVAVKQAGADELAILAAVQEARRTHLAALLKCLRPGGTGLLITDFVSSDSAPELAGLDDSHLLAFAAACLAAGNFFTGLNPATILQQMQSDPSLVGEAERVEVIPPWKWHFGPRTYLVYALRFDRTVKS